MRKGIWTGSVNFRHGYTHNPVYSDVSYLGDGKFMSNSRNFNSQVEYDSWISVGVNGLAKMFGGNVTLEYVRYEAKGEQDGERILTRSARRSHCGGQKGRSR